MGEERQLDIFKTKRQRGLKPKGPSEFLIHCAVADMLRRGLKPGWTWKHVPNGGERPATIGKDGKRLSLEGGRLARMGTKPGASDIELHKAPHAQLHCLELKAKGGKLSEAQIAYLDEQEAIGAVCAVADSVDKALEILRAWGAIRTSLPP